MSEILAGKTEVTSAAAEKKPEPEEREELFPDFDNDFQELVHLQGLIDIGKLPINLNERLIELRSKHKDIDKFMDAKEKFERGVKLGNGEKKFFNRLCKKFKIQPTQPE